MTSSVPPPLPSQETQCRWFYAKAEKPIGPLSFRELESLARNGVIQPQTLVLREGEEEWQQFAAFSSAAPTTATRAHSSTTSGFSAAMAKFGSLPLAAKIILLVIGLFAGLIAMLFVVGVVAAVLLPASNNQHHDTNASRGAATGESGKRSMSKEDAAVALRDVEDLANDLESLLADLQDGRTVTVETLGKVNRWKSEVRSTRNMISAREIRQFAASTSLMAALDNMEQAMRAFERAAGARNETVLSDASFAHAEMLRLMHENIESAKAWMAEGKY